MNGTTPKVTVILTVYERTQFLREAIQGVLQQDYDNYEVLVTDDSASAKIQSICESLNVGGRIRYRSNSPRAGVALNVRAAWMEARGEFVTILNDDDAWEPGFLRHLVSALQKNPDCVLAFSDHWLMDSQGQIDIAATDANTRLYRRDRLPAGPISATADLVLIGNSVPLVMAAVIKKSAIPPEVLSREVGGAYDFWLSCCLAATGRPFCYVPERLTRYRLHPQMETARQAEGKSLEMVHIFQALLDTNKFPRHAPLIRRRLAGAFFQCGKESLQWGNRRNARHYFKRSLATAVSLRPIVGLMLACLPDRKTGDTNRDPA
ncbi:MAG: glycosyltransferase family A protein [Verrucomicrobiota bacterium]